MAGEWKKLLDDARLDPAERAKVESAIADIDRLAGTVLDNGVLRQSDYSRRQDELRTQGLQYDKNAAALAEQYNQLVAYTDAVEAERDAAAKALADKITPNTPPKPPDTIEVGTMNAPPAPPAPPLPPGLTRADAEAMLAAQARELAAGQLGYFSEVLSIGHQHQQLFNKPLDSAQLIKEAIAAKQTPDAYWRGKYNPDARREELAKSADDKRLADARADERAKVISEYSNPASRPLQPSENPFYDPLGSGADTAADPFGDVETEGDRAMLAALEKVA
jgi:hypothetical protein